MAKNKKGALILSLKKSANKAAKNKKKKSGVIISEKTAQKKQAEKKAKKTNTVESAKKAANKGLNVSGLGTKVKTHTETYKDKKGNKTNYTYTDLNREEYGKMTTAAMTGQMNSLMKSDKKLAKKVADVNVKDYAKSPGVMGALDQMTQGLSVSENPVYDYSDSQKKIIDSQKQTGKYNVGRAVGAVAEFGFGGTGTVGSSIAKTGGKAVLKEAAEQGGKKLAKQTAKNIAKETAGDVVASAGLNTLDAVKFSYEDGKLNREKFVKELALNVGGDILIGGAVSGVTHKLSAVQAKNFNRIVKKLQKGESISEAEQKFFKKHEKEIREEVEAKLKQENERQATKPSDAVDKPVGKSQGAKQVVKATDEVTTQADEITPQKATEVSTVAKKETVEQPKAETPKQTGDTTPLSQRNIESVGNRKQKAYMYENPEVKPYFQDEARVLLNDLQNNYIKGEKGFSNTMWDETGDGFFGTTRNIDDDVAELKEKFNWSYEDIERGLKNIIEDNGKENNAVSKRLEFLIDERLRNGYDDFQYGERIPGNDEYVALLRDKEISAYDDEAFNQWARSLYDDAPSAVKNSDAEWDETSNKAANYPGKQYDTIADSVKAENKAHTAQGVRDAYKREQGGDFVSDEDQQFVRTVFRSEQCTDDALRADLKDMTEKGLFKKPDRLTKDEALEKGKARVQANAQAATDQFVNNVNDGKKLTIEDFATGTELLIHYKNVGDVANWRKVVKAMADGYSDAGYILQSARMVNRMTPEGRATQVLKLADKVKKDFAKNRGKDIDIQVSDETIERILNADGEEELAKAFADAKVEIWNQCPSSFMERLQAAQRMAMLGNPKTMLRNIAGNLIFAPFRAMSDTFETGFQRLGADKLAKLDGGRTKKFVKAEDKEAYASYKKFGEDIFDTYYKQYGDAGKYADSYGRPHDANIFNNRSGKLFESIANQMSGKSAPSQGIKNMLNYMGDKGVMQSGHNLVMGALEKGDMLIFKPEFKRSFAQYCYARGLDPAKMTKAQLDEAALHALNDAQHATFRDESALANLLAKKQSEWMTKNNGLSTLGYRAGAVMLQTMLPFKKTPINIAKTGIDYSPVGIAKGIVRRLSTGKVDADQLLLSYKEMAQGLTGTGVMIVGAYLYHQGVVTVKAGNWSSDEWYDKEMGNQDFSIKIGDQTFSMSWCAPMNMPFMMGAAFQEARESEGLSFEASLNLLSGMAEPFFEMSFMQSVKNFLLDNETLEDYAVDLSTMPLQYVQQLIPSMSSQFATVMDDWQRDTTSFVDGTLTNAWHKEFLKAVNKIPGLREKVLQPKVDRYGKNIESSAGKNLFEKIMITFFSTATIKDIKMTADDRYLIDCINETTDEKQKAAMIPDSGSYDAGREDDKASTPEERTKYQKQRGKEFQKLISKQRTAPYVSELSKQQRRSKIVSARYAAKAYADAKTYGYRYALKAEDMRNARTDYPTETYKDFKQFKNANPSKTAKDYFDAYYSIKTTAISAGDKEYATKGLALYKAGADNATFRHFGVDIEKRNVFKNYLKNYKGSEDEYYAATNAIQRKKKGNKATVLEKVMTLAERKEPDRVYYAVGVLGEDNEQMNLGRGLIAEGFTIAEINSYKQNAQSYNEDGKGSLKKEEAKEYVESLGLKSQTQKALVFATLSSAKNPFGSVGTYSLESDVLKASSSSSDGSGGGSSKKKSANLPSWESWVKDFLENDTMSHDTVELKDWDSPLNAAYRKKITSLNTK